MAKPSSSVVAASARRPASVHVILSAIAVYSRSDWSRLFSCCEAVSLLWGQLRPLPAGWLSSLSPFRLSCCMYPSGVRWTGSPPQSPCSSCMLSLLSSIVPPASLDIQSRILLYRLPWAKSSIQLLMSARDLHMDLLEHIWQNKKGKQFRDTVPLNQMSCEREKNHRSPLKGI